MTTAIILTTFNRPAETARCFATLKNADIVPGTTFIIVDDASTDPATLALINGFQIPDCNTIILRNERNSKIYASLLRGYDLAFSIGCEIVMNLDNDTLVNNLFQSELLKLKMIWQRHICTGFNCTTLNRDGSERHKMTGGLSGCNFKESIGGINMVVHKEQYDKYMRPALVSCVENGGNWDHKTCINSMADGKRIVCLQPSVIQHQATASSMGHNEPPDVATDFKGLTLPDITLVCVDDDASRGYKALQHCLQNIRAKAVLISAQGNVNMGRADASVEFVHVPPLGSKEAYSRFIMNDLFQYVTASHVLIIQHDGYVTNWEAWDKSWLQYDYIGAPWGIEYAPNRVGNGGFSLRSQKLLRLTSGLNWPVTHPEDAVICRELRPKLESEYDVKFAPFEVAERFSFEGYNQPEVYNGQFGVHGPKGVEQATIWPLRQWKGQQNWAWHERYIREHGAGNDLKQIRAENWVKGVVPPPAGLWPQRSNTAPPVGLIFNQFLGLGDILFLVPLARHYMSKGHDIVWPVADEYQPDLKRHFPDIQFVRKSTFPMNYDRRDVHMHRWQYGTYKVLPLRWNLCNTRDGSDAMTSKYTMVGEDWKMWRGLRWERDLHTELLLSNEVGLAMETGEYEVHCDIFGCLVTGGKKFRSVGHSRLYSVNIRIVDGFSLLDWSLILENATIIHAVSSSTLYMLETLPLKAREIHLYGRDNGMRDFDYVRPLLTKDYIFHE